MVDCEGQLVL